MIFPNTDPRLIEKDIQVPGGAIHAETCSQSRPTVSVDMKRLRTVKVPVLITAGGRDVTFTSDGVRHQRRFYKGSKDVTVAILAHTSHFPMLGRTAPRFRATISDWLRKRFG